MSQEPNDGEAQTAHASSMWEAGGDAAEDIYLDVMAREHDSGTMTQEHDSGLCLGNRMMGKV